MFHTGIKDSLESTKNNFDKMGMTNALMIESMANMLYIIIIILLFPSLCEIHATSVICRIF